MKKWLAFLLVLALLPLMCSCYSHEERAERRAAVAAIAPELEAILPASDTPVHAVPSEWVNEYHYDFHCKSLHWGTDLYTEERAIADGIDPCETCVTIAEKELLAAVLASEYVVYVPLTTTNKLFHTQDCSQLRSDEQAMALTIRQAIDFGLEADRKCKCPRTEEEYAELIRREANATPLPTAKPTPAPVPALEGEGQVDDCYVKIVDAEMGKDYDGSDCIIITYAWSHEQKDSTSFTYELRDTVYQDGIECSLALLVDGVNSSDEFKDIKSGVTFEFRMGYLLNNTTSPVEVEVRAVSWLSDDKVVKVFELPL